MFNTYTFHNIPGGHISPNRFEMRPRVLRVHDVQGRENVATRPGVRRKNGKRNFVLGKPPTRETVSGGQRQH